MNYKKQKSLLIIIISIFFFINSVSFSQSKLPECIKLNENNSLFIDFKTFNNCHAKVQLENLDIYDGEFKNGQMDGVGNYYAHFPSFSGYQGEFKNNKFEGKGKYFLRKKMYDGEFKNGKYNGEGTLYFHVNEPSKNYKGGFKNGHFNGKGILTLNQNVYEGEFKDGEIIKGSVTFNLLDESFKDKIQIIYRGEFKNRYPNGKGTLEKADEIYVGEFIDGLKHGKGTLTFKTERKDKYIGEFKNGQATGKGTYIYENGDKYVGEFKNMKKHGQGVYIFLDGRKMEGKFENDIKVGKFIYYSKDGKQVFPENDSNKQIIDQIKEVTQTVKLGNGLTWKGNLKNGIPHGIGELIELSLSTKTKVCGLFDSGYFKGIVSCNE
jgi:hypothetical protein